MKLCTFGSVLYVVFTGFFFFFITPAVRFAQYRTSPLQQQQLQQQQQQLMLKPLFFEVPQQESDPLFLGREWLVQDISNALLHVQSPGVVITGMPGTGKTAFVLQLVEHSCFGRLKSNRKCRRHTTRAFVVVSAIVRVI